MAWHTRRLTDRLLLPPSRIRCRDVNFAKTPSVSFDKPRSPSRVSSSPPFRNQPAKTRSASSSTPAACSVASLRVGRFLLLASLPFFIRTKQIPTRTEIKRKGIPFSAKCAICRLRRRRSCPGAGERSLVRPQWQRTWKRQPGVIGGGRRIEAVEI